MTTQTERVNMFIAYAPEDIWLLRQLETHLSLLKREGLISTWCDRQVIPGTNWAGVIDQRLEEALLILLLVSVDFLASDYCYQVEIKHALERHQSNKALVVPVLARPVDWKSSPFGHLQVLPSGGKPITAWGNRDKAWVEVVTGLRQVVQELLKRVPVPTYNTWSTTESEPFIARPGMPARNTQGVTPPDQVQPPSQALRSPEGKNRRPGSDAQRRSSPEGVSEPSQRRTPFGAPFPETWNVPRGHSLFFTGRSAVLDQLASAFHQENSAGMITPQVLTGLGGMGKTQVAAEYAFQFRGDYQAVLWIRAESEKSLLADFKAVANQMKLVSPQTRDQTRLVQAVHSWCRDQSDWLLIFDNVDNPAIVHTFLPQAARGHILATTRAGAVVSWGRSLKLKALEVEAGALCILRRAGLLDEHQALSEAFPEDVEAAQQLARQVDGLPLALEQAGAYINDTECGMRGYFNLYQQFWTELRQTKSGWVYDYPESVASVWLISRHMVNEQSPAATELLRLCAFLAPDGIPDDLLELGANALGPLLGPVARNRLALNREISLLRRFSLINREADRSSDSTRLSIHRIMQEILLDEMDPAMRELWAMRAVLAVELAARTASWSLLHAQAHHCQGLIEQWHMTFREAKRLLDWIKQQEQS